MNNNNNANGIYVSPEFKMELWNMGLQKGLGIEKTMRIAGIVLADYSAGLLAGAEACLEEMEIRVATAREAEESWTRGL